jgi:hypothetical protein
MFKIPTVSFVFAFINSPTEVSELFTPLMLTNVPKCQVIDFIGVA